MTDDSWMVNAVAPEVEAPLPPRGFRAPGTTLLLGGTLFGAVAAYLFQVYGIRTLGEAGFAPIAYLWTVFFILVTVVLVPLEQYVTRESSRGRRVLRADRAVIAVTAAGASTIGAVFAALTLDSLFDGDAMFVVFLALLPIGYATLTVGKGVLAGQRRFGHIGWILFWEGAVRLAAALILVAIARSTRSLAWAMAVAPFAALGTRFWRFDRETLAVENTLATGFLGAYIAGSGASQLLLAGAPLGIAALGGSPEVASVVFVTFTLFRAPLTLIYSLQGRILPFLVSIAEQGGGFRSIVARMVGGGVGLAVAGGAVGWLIGPEVVELLFDATPDRLVAACAAGGVVMASTTQVSSQVLVAQGGTGRLAIAWVVGLVVALAILPFIGLAADRAVAIAFLAGEAAALSVAAALAFGRR